MSFRYQDLTIAGFRLRAAVQAGPANAERPPLLLLNGIGFNAEVMAPFANALKNRTVVCPDLPGCGGSSVPRLPYAMPLMAHAICALMDKLYPRQAFDCVGFSWGGALAQQIAVQAQHRVNSLTLVSTTSGTPLPLVNFTVLERLFDPTEFVDPRKLAANFRVLMVEGGASAGLMRRFSSPTPTGLWCQLLALTGWSVAPMLPFLRMPALLVSTADDPIVSTAHQKMLAALVPHAERIIIPSGGHLAPLATPNKLVPDLVEFLDRRRNAVKPVFPFSLRAVA